MKTINLVSRDGTRELWGVLADDAPASLAPLRAYLKRTRDPRSVEILGFVERATKNRVEASDETLPAPRP